MTDYWRTTTSLGDNNVRWEFDANSFLSELTERMRSIEDDAAESVIVEWLRARGWTVERNDGKSIPFSVEF